MADTKTPRKHKSVVVALSVSGVVLSLGATFFTVLSAARSEKHNWTALLQSLQGTDSSMLGSVLSSSSGDAKVKPNKLLEIRIEPAAPRPLEVNQNKAIKLTAYGKFSVGGSSKLKANWYTKKGTDKEVAISGCQMVETCSYKGSMSGTVVVIAKVGSVQSSVAISIRSKKTSFIDEVPSWADEAVHSLSEISIIQGYDDGRFGAADALTRGQIITMIDRLLTHSGLVEEATDCAALPLAQDHYAYGALCLFVNRGWETVTNLQLDSIITRGDAAAYVNRVFGSSLLSALGQSQGALLARGQIFSDVPVTHPFFFDTAVTSVTGVMEGSGDGTFQVHQALNRAEFATVLQRVLDAVEAYAIENV